MFMLRIPSVRAGASTLSDLTSIQTQIKPTLTRTRFKRFLLTRRLTMSLRRQICVCVFISMLLLSLPGVAQETTGGIQGTVKDPQGAVVPAATVEVTSPALIGKKSATTDAGGFYHFEQLPPGIYSINVNAPGFAPQTQGSLQVTTGSLPTVNFSLQVGAITQEVS